MMSWEVKCRIQREMISTEYRCKQMELDGRGCISYPNQQEAAQQIIEHYKNGKYLVVLIAQPGAGKTGVVLEVTKQMTTHIDDDQCIDASNVFILSGMNDIDWNVQFKSKMLRTFQDNVYHRGAINAPIQNRIAEMTNGLCCTDECQIACGSKMKVANVLASTGLTDLAVARARNMKLLDVSATPETVAYDSENWGTNAAIVILPTGENYKGFQVMLDENRIREAPHFENYDQVLAFLNDWSQRYASLSQKKFFPIRLLPTSTTLKGWFESAFVALGWGRKHHNSTDRIGDIDLLMETAPEKHTAILIKGFWRASKRLVRKHVGGCYEEIPQKQNDTAAAQGLIARFCDNYEYEGDELNPDLRPVHYGDVKAIKSYLKWFERGCDYSLADYQSARIKSKNGRVKSTPSKVHHSVMKNMDAAAVAAAVAAAAAAAAATSYTISNDEFSTRELAHAWALENIAHPNQTPINVIETDINGNHTAKTHMSSDQHRGRDGNCEPIVPLSILRQMGNFARWHRGDGVRCVPVISSTDSTVNHYVIVYKPAWLKSATEGAAAGAAAAAAAAI
uniref:Uncharacterized protein n=1 Tax=viral metagenome TaxID=1070528 RepID=A0A6C0I4M2_9ZZZZ